MESTMASLIRKVLGAVLLGSLLLTGAVAVAQTKPPFEDDILAFEKQDRERPPKPGGILFIGSSSIRMWTTLAKDFPQYDTLNRGFGGSQIADSVRYTKRIVIPYRPRLIVFFAGTNDVAAGKSAVEIEKDYRAFVEGVRAELPKVPIVYLSITPAPSRWDKLAVIQEANQRIRAYSEKTNGLRFLDLYGEFVDAQGGPRPELFLEDRLHLNPKGYKVWARRLRPVLAELLP